MSLTTIIIIVFCIVVVVLVFVFLAFGRDVKRFTFDIGGAAPRATGGADESAEGMFKSRLAGLTAAGIGVISLLLARLWSMQLISSEDYIEQAESNRTRTISLTASRGRILDRNGVELVSNRISLTVVADSEVADQAVECQLLANLIGMPALAVRRKIKDTTEGAQSARAVASDVSRRVVAYIEERPYLFDGITVEERSVRMYPQGNLAAHVLGYTGTITAEQLEANDDSDEGSITYQSGDMVGQSGIEYQYESVLQGVRGEQIVYVNADGNVLSYSTTIEPEAGSDIRITIDATIQKAAEESLSSVIKSISESTYPDCTSGCVVCMDVTNGEIIAMASQPTFSPNSFVGGISAADWSDLSADEANDPLLNRVISGQYASASTIKPLTSFAALDFGIATANSSFYCDGWWTGLGEDYGQWCYDHDGHGYMTLQSGITYSCDVVFYEIGKGFFYSSDQDGMQETFRRWGLGQLEGIDLPNEEAGRVPDADWKWNYYTWADDTARNWQGGDCTNLAIGQGDLLVTPLQMVCVYAGISMRGTCYKPHVLLSVMSHEGEGSVIAHNTEVLREVVEDESEYELVEGGLSGVIYEESEAQSSHFTNMKELVAGKTGTAEVNNGQDPPNGWFVAYVPADNPKYAIASVIEGGGYGNVSAMYVVRDVMGAIYDEPDTSEEISESDG